MTRPQNTMANEDAARGVACSITGAAKGRLDECRSDWFEGMTITVEREGDGPPITTLAGTVADQAALQGVLRTLYTLGLAGVLCDVRQVRRHTAARLGARAQRLTKQRTVSLFSVGRGNGGIMGSKGY